MKVLQDEIYLRRHHGHEYHVPLPMELSWQAIDANMDHGPTLAIAIYRYEKSNAIDVHVYKLEGVRVEGFHLTTACTTDPATPEAKRRISLKDIYNKISGWRKSPGR